MSTRAKEVRTAYIALGSNLGSAGGGSAVGGSASRDPAATLLAGLRAVVERLGEPEGVRVSSLYATAPVGFRDQPSFINAAASVPTSLGPAELLQLLLEVETAFGRRREVPNGPRTLDLDLLMVDDLVLATAVLVLPHPRMTERRFVLEPLVELAPGLVHPVLGQSMAALLALLPDAGEQARTGVKRLPDSHPGAVAYAEESR